MLSISRRTFAILLGAELVYAIAVAWISVVVHQPYLCFGEFALMINAALPFIEVRRPGASTET